MTREILHVEKMNVRSSENYEVLAVLEGPLGNLIALLHIDQLSLLSILLA